MALADGVDPACTLGRADHSWPHARRACRLRDGDMCRRCGRGPGALVVLAALYEMAAGDWSGEVAAEWSEWLWATGFNDWVNVQIEVNHRQPIGGRHAEHGCLHHRDGLEALCHSCHVAVTAEQFGTTAPARLPW